VDFDPVNGGRYLRFCYAGAQAEATEAVARLTHWLRPATT